MNEENEYLVKNKYLSIKSSILAPVLYIGLASWLLFGIAQVNFGNEIIDHWFEKPRPYTTQYWVYLQPDVSSTKTYRLKAKIQKLHLENDEGWGYFLRTVYWNNGGSSDFDECQLTSVKGDECIDYEGRSYYIRLGEKPE